jgi:hypothetical protein
VFFVLGLILCAFGVFHSIGSYPSPDNFARFADALPTVSAIASFAVGILASLVGLILLVPSLLRLRVRRQTQRLAYLGSRSPYADRGIPATRPTPPRHEEEYDADPDGFGGDDYRGGYGSRQHDNGEYDPRRYAGSYR